LTLVVHYVTTETYRFNNVQQYYKRIFFYYTSGFTLEFYKCSKPIMTSKKDHGLIEH